MQVECYLIISPAGDRVLHYFDFQCLLAKMVVSCFLFLFQPPIVVLSVVVVEAEGLEAKDANGEHLFPSVSRLIMQTPRNMPVQVQRRVYRNANEFSIELRA